MSSLIHSYYESGVQDQDDKTKRLYICKLCKIKGVHKQIKCTNTTTSNLITHLQCQMHVKEYEEYLDKIKQKENENITPSKRAVKRLRYESPAEYNNSPYNQSQITSSILCSPKYSNSSVKQKERYVHILIIFSSFKRFYIFRYNRLLKMLVRCMLPLSLVENNGFQEFESYLDPSFKIPTRKTVKLTGIPTLKDLVFNKMKDLLKNVEFQNVLVDGWSDNTARPFNGYVCQGIDSDWNLLTIPIDFRHMKGNLRKLLKINSNLYLLLFN